MNGMYRNARRIAGMPRSAPARIASCASTSAMPSVAKARASSRKRLRENWSSTMISASLPSGVARHEASSPRAAAACVSPKRARIWASNAMSFSNSCSGVASSNQKCSTSCGFTLKLLLPSRPGHSNPAPRRLLAKCAGHQLVVESGRRFAIRGIKIDRDLVDRLQGGLDQGQGHQVDREDRDRHEKHFSSAQRRKEEQHHGWHDAEQAEDQPEAHVADDLFAPGLPQHFHRSLV